MAIPAVQNPATDLFVVGGGINGAGIARDAAGRGLSVTLCEQGDLGGATSSASSKLIHGGLRYLEHYEFRLVREALLERERLLKIAPHIIWPLDFVLPHERSLRPAWLVRLGLFLYDHLAPRRTLPGTRSIRLDRHPAGAALRPGLRQAFVYADCWVEDARLVVLNARDAAERGARILTHTRLVQASRTPQGWACDIAFPDGRHETVMARCLVNAAGPWVTRVLNQAVGLNSAKQVRLIKGSHIVLPRLHAGPEAFILQNVDRRIVFAIPYEQNYTLVGTTDVPFDGDPARVSIDPDETHYLCELVNHYFRRTVTAADIVWSYSGVRPLYDDAAAEAQAVTRDYVLDLESVQGQPALLSVFGGKLTTYRRLAEHALEKLAPHLTEMGPSWTAQQPLPGGDIPNGDFEAFLKDLHRRHAALPQALVRRLARAYGTRAERILDDVRTPADLGRDFGGGLHQREVDYLVDQEWAETSDDILWRRSKLGLHVPPSTAEALDDVLGRRASAAE